jgi:hypothetical protein
MLTPRFLEALNGTLFNLLLFGSFMFGVYMLREIRMNGFQRARLQAAISIFVLISGEAVIRGWIWYWRHLDNTGQPVGWMSNHPTLVLGAAWEIIGIICVIRVFAPDTWGRNVWVVTTLVATGVTTAFMYF